MAQARAERRAAEATEALAAAEAARQESEQLQSQLADLEAKQTERGLVLTLGEVLFDTDKAELNDGADSTVDRLADFMEEYPERKVLIEGHTDSRGDAGYNQQLSERRAEAVGEALTERGVDSTRVQTKGLGQSYPVASNDTSAGMQRNRRVEIVISDQNGEFPAAANRQ